MKGLLFFVFAPALCACTPRYVTKIVTVTAYGDSVQNYGPASSSNTSTTTVVQQPTQNTFQTAVSSSQCYGNGSPSNTVSGGSSGSTYNPLPQPAIFRTESPPNFNPLVNQPGMAVIKNSCHHSIFFTSQGCGTGTQNHEIAAGETYTEPTRNCTDVGMQLQIKKEASDNVMLVEYGADNQQGIFYDLSFLVCMKPESTDLSGCAGWDHGHQCGSGKNMDGTNCPVFACQPGEYCDRTSYTVPEYGLTKENAATRQSVAAPVGRCGLSEGIVWEVCAGNGKK